MIEQLLELLSVDDFYGKSKYIDIAKGINEAPRGVRDGLKKHKREKAWQ